MSAVAAALGLAELHIPSFPCLDNKAPACPLGFKAATADPDSLRALWRRHPGPLIGVPTGGASGIDALDIDPRHGGDAWLSVHCDRLPPTRRHETRSGGHHLLFRAATGLRSSASRIAPGVDVRAAGGFIVWWPAAGLVVPVSGPLAPWPDWLLEILQPRSTPHPEPVRHIPRNMSETAVERIISRVLFRLETAPAGERHIRLRAAACTIGGLLQSADIGAAEAAIVLLDAVKRAGGSAVVERNAQSTIAWGLNKGARSPFSVGGRDA